MTVEADPIQRAYRGHGGAVLANAAGPIVDAAGVVADVGDDAGYHTQARSVDPEGVGCREHRGPNLNR